MKRLTHLSLFSGIGGLDLAAEMAGFVTVGQCEWADYPTKVLEKHWPDVPRWRDIRTLTGDSFYERTGLRTVDVISGGFPCQPFSQAGKRRGKEDDRYLWPEMLRVITEIRPAWVLGENVPGIINLALDQVLFDLESIGYSALPFIIPACGVDAPHRRDRICIVANTKRTELNGTVMGTEKAGIAGPPDDGGNVSDADDRSGTVRRHREFQETAEAGGPGADIRERTETDEPRERREPESGIRGMADGIRTAVHEADPDADSYGLQGRSDNKMLAAAHTHTHTHGRGYDGLLRSLVEVTPLGKTGQLNPTWVEWLMGYPIGWTELNASETR